MSRRTHRPAIWAHFMLAATLSLPPLSASAQDAKPGHPLDALTDAELTRAKAILAAEGKISAKTRFHSVELDEPEKAAVLEWRPGTNLPRRAIAVVSDAGAVHEAAVDLSDGRMTTLVQCPAGSDSCSQQASASCGGAFDVVRQSTENGTLNLIYACRAK